MKMRMILNICFMIMLLLYAENSHIKVRAGPIPDIMIVKRGTSTVMLTSQGKARTFALQWTSSATFPNGTRVNACLGGNVTFPWAFNLTSSEHVIDVEWYLQYQNREIPLAAYIGDRFMAYDDLASKLHFVPNAGLQLTGVTSSDLGLYTVRVNLNGDQTSSQSADLHEPSGPVTNSGSLQAFIRQVTELPVIKGETHLQLGCGYFRSLGEPPISVSWRTPSGQFSDSTFTDGYIFVLTLPNPIEGGNYTCQLKSASTIQRCLNSALFNTVSTVHVDEVTSSLLLLRNDVKWLRQENEAYINQFELVDAYVRPNSCLNVKEYDDDNRVHTIYPNGAHPVKVYCDQTTDTGGWTVIQKRQDGSVEFYRNWTEYESGFGNPESDYWIGLSNLHVMTSGKTAILRVDLMDFNGNTAYAMYHTFNVSGPEDNYRLKIGGYQGTAGDSLEYNNNMQFSTHDRDHDTFIGWNCAEFYQGAWWYRTCTNANLNGQYSSSVVNSQQGIWWYLWHSNQSLKRVEIKIRV